jgi:hypothetical protein
MAVVGYGNESYKLRQGFVNASQMTDTYLVTAFTRFTDMGGLKWFNPSGSNVYNQAAQVEGTLAGGAKFIGKAFFSWTLSGLTPEMVDFILDDSTMFNGQAGQDFTAVTWNMAKNRWEIVWVKATVGILSDNEPGYNRGLTSLTINFVTQQDAP